MGCSYSLLAFRPWPVQAALDRWTTQRLILPSISLQDLLFSLIYPFIFSIVRFSNIEILKILKMSYQNKDALALRIIYALSGIVLLFLVWFIYGKQSAESNASFIAYLPHVNAFLNSVTTVLLVTGYIFIKKKNESAHIKAMVSAVVFSALFLISYLTYHHFQGDTKFIAQGLIRPIYFFILISHIVLSAVMLPMIFTTLFHAAKGNREKHKKIAKITFPIWLYVSVTGVLIFIFLQFFNS